MGTLELSPLVRQVIDPNALEGATGVSSDSPPKGRNLNWANRRHKMDCHISAVCQLDDRKS